MIVTAHQPEHLPWLGFFHKMALAERYIVQDTVQYRKLYFQNRNRIPGPEGPMWLTVPVMKLQSHYGPIEQVMIDQRQAWLGKYWRSLENTYRRHPFYARYAEPLHAILATPYEYLIDLNMALIHFFRDELGIRTPIVRASALAVSGHSSEQLFNLMTKIEATTYLSGPSGRDYLDEAPFRAAGIEVRYHAFEHPVYPQAGRPTFEPCMSVLDLLLNCGPESREILLDPQALSQAQRSLRA